MPKLAKGGTFFKRFFNMERFMLKTKDMAKLGVFLVVAFLFSLIPPAIVKPVAADLSMLAWSVIDTPSSQYNIVVSPSEINTLAIGSDDKTFYALDIPLPSRLFKSDDGGITWQTELSAKLITAGAFMPIWNIALAPDDVNFVVAVTDSTGGTPLGGPGQVYISTNGGAKWDVAVNGLTLNPGELISCIDISVTYGGINRDIAIGTRDGAGTGRVFIMEAVGFGSWNQQVSAPSTGWVAGDVVAVKFSPSYPTDSSLIVVSSSGADTRLQLGIHDSAANNTTWNSSVGYPVQLWDPIFAGNSPTVGQIITADMEFPSDFSGQDLGLLHFYVSTDATGGAQGGVYRVDDNVVFLINPPTSGRISSIAYFGATATGVLLAGEVTDDPAFGLVNIWRTLDSTVTTPTWLRSDTYKSPTGGGNNPAGYANAQVAWNSTGTMAYCGTSSACLGLYTFPLGVLVCPEWPEGYLNSIPFDESAFSVSPYSSDYSQILSSFPKDYRPQDTDIGNIWNQLSLIDTEMDELTDVAVLQAPSTAEAGTEGGTTSDYDILYLYSFNNNLLITAFDSIWRSTSDPLGRTWERVLCVPSNYNKGILRVKQTAYKDTDRSARVVFANLGTNRVGTSTNEGQLWNISYLTDVTDMALASDTIMYILNDRYIYRYKYEAYNWVLTHNVNTELLAGHTIAVPLTNPSDKEMVVVGEAGPPSGTGRIVYADFSETLVTGGPPDNQRIAPPIEGDAHVIFDDKFEDNEIIYNAVHDSLDGSGKIYRWIIGESTAWDELEPPNTAFYGLAQRNRVLYGAWRTPEVTEIIANNAGVDRTLYPWVNVPPPPEWDYLVAELPTSVLFNREPSSLKVSSNSYNNLWAIDNSAYNFATKSGCLWGYTDIMAKVGPWTTLPASGSLIPVDPKTGRASEVNFSWRQISYVTAYELQIAKDEDFHIKLLVAEDITPLSQLSPSVYFPAGGLAPASGSNIGGFANLESGHTYYWRVRARRAITGEIARSPWSATMSFTIQAGLPTASPYPTMTLFSPMYGAKNVSNSPGFSWSKLPGITKYEFTLARDPALQSVVVRAEVPMTSYLYDGKLDNNTTYYWQVRAIEPVVSDPSAVGTFTVVAATKPVTRGVETPATTPSWVWWIIAVFAALVVSIIAFTMTKPSYGRAGGGKLFKVEPIVEKPKSPAVEKPKNVIVDKIRSSMSKTWGKIRSSMSKTWGSITTSIRRWRFLKKKGKGVPEDNKPEDSQDKLT
jgi:hypothetical protein